MLAADFKAHNRRAIHQRTSSHHSAVLTNGIMHRLGDRGSRSDAGQRAVRKTVYGLTCSGQGASPRGKPSS